ncbi:HdeD family acid-resistance protein [Corynebacterium sputi]|uniref:HdeD family acid-resistance protein n=1 Tax=Corynebacterium sputi TaxID=489915 RepID=UPI00047BF4BA|nr:DUF308 domain-containing protein [Corynebacterium sputi]
MTNQVAIDPQNPFKLARSVLAFTGAVALILGILILAWPTATGRVVTWIIIAYGLLAGVAYIVGGFMAKSRSGWSRAGSIIVGLIFIIAAIVLFGNLAASTVAFAVILGIVIGVSWIVEGIFALMTLRGSRSTGWSLFYGILSIIAGIILVTTPFWGAVTLWWLFGVSLVILGIVQLVRAFQIGKEAEL